MLRLKLMSETGGVGEVEDAARCSALMITDMP